MQVKTFTGSSSQEVMAQIKAEMGPDAVILGNRTYRKNGVVHHEITAGLERQHSGSTVASASAPEGMGDWQKEWMQIKDHLFALMKPAMQLERLTPRQRVALEYLQREGVSDQVAVDLYNRLLAKPGASVLESLDGMVPVKGFDQINWPQHVQLFIGPSGFGKTTVALRFALQVRKNDPKARIVFINADCQRGNGRIILRHWAELSNFVYLEAADADTMKRALVQAQAASIVFVDVPSLPRERTLAGWREEMGLDGGDVACHLALMPFCDAVQMQDFLRRYGIDGEGSIVWTKLDESVSFGGIVNVALQSGLPISALSYGAELQDSLVPATEALVWRLVFKRQLPGRTA